MSRSPWCTASAHRRIRVRMSSVSLTAAPCSVGSVTRTTPAEARTHPFPSGNLVGESEPTEGLRRQERDDLGDQTAVDPNQIEAERHVGAASVVPRIGAEGDLLVRP